MIVDGGYMLWHERSVSFVVYIAVQWHRFNLFGLDCGNWQRYVWSFRALVDVCLQIADLRLRKREDNTWKGICLEFMDFIP